MSRLYTIKRAVMVLVALTLATIPPFAVRSASKQGDGSVEVIQGCTVKFVKPLSFGHIWRPRKVRSFWYRLHEHEGWMKKSKDQFDHEFEFVVGPHQRGRFQIFCLHRHPVHYDGIIVKNFSAPGIKLVDLTFYPPSPAIPVNGMIDVYFAGQLQVDDYSNVGLNGGGEPSEIKVIAEYE